MTNQPKLNLHPFSYQAEIINKGQEYYAKQTNGKLIMPCGSGKTITSFYLVANALKARTIVYFFPTLQLLSQTLEVWENQIENSEQYFALVCGSDKTISTNNFTATSDQIEFIQQLKSVEHDKFIIFSTYDSSRLVADAVRELNLTIDFFVFDEAHHTAGLSKEKYQAGLNIDPKHYQRRLFMTATPKMLSFENYTDNNAKIEVYSMDDETIYGKEFYNLSIQTAIENGIISDYKIITAHTENEEILKLWNLDAFVRDTKNLIEEPIYFKYFSIAVSVLKAVKRLNLKKIITFNNTIEGSVLFGVIIKKVAFLLKLKTDVYNINSNHSDRERRIIINSFKHPDNTTIITNARLLGEGFDVPACDAVVFVDKRNSVIDITQAAGRAWRKEKYKRYGYIVLPITIDNDNTQTGIDTLGQVLLSIAGNDKRLLDEIDDVNKKKTSKKNNERIIETNIHDINLQNTIHKLQFNIWTRLNYSNRYWDVETSKNWVQKYLVPVGIKNNKDYHDWCKGLYPDLPDKPKEIPIVYYAVYNISAADWFGVDNIHSIGYWDVETAKKWVQSNLVTIGINTYEKYSDWAKGIYPETPKKPKKLPAAWQTRYNITTAEWFGVENAHSIDYWDVETAKKWVQANLVTIGIDTYDRYSNWANGLYPNAPKRPMELPKRWSAKYNISTAEWFGIPVKPQYHIKYWDLNKAKAWVQKHLTPIGIDTILKYNDWYKGLYPDAPKKPKELPFTFGSKYNISTAEWFGKEDYFKKEYWDLETAKKWVQKHLVPIGINTYQKYQEWSKGLFANAPKRPKGLPGNWQGTYKISTAEFFGKLL